MASATAPAVACIASRRVMMGPAGCNSDVFSAMKEHPLQISYREEDRTYAATSLSQSFGIVRILR
ncbi:hypothetical protein BQ8482_200007 [Mesorhizobium delmotii]|uniref:Uncharacterized protein n=1 Tax=Mesorhizobium delmotii TaxID=1631247 RepID=A0A2P9AKS6_9HYPH|nr:hypothetical protein BQ8482_200007 [Mesorhizobium delmotii]